MLSVLQSYVIPVILSIVSAYMSVQITISTLELDVDYIKRDIALQKNLLEQSRENQLELRARSVWMTNREATDERQNEAIERILDRLERVENANL